MFGFFLSPIEDNDMLLWGPFTSKGDMRSSMIRSKSVVSTSWIEPLLKVISRAGTLRKYQLHALGGRREV